MSRKSKADPPFDERECVDRQFGLDLRRQTGLAAICAPVWMELYRGIRGKREEDELQRLRELCHWPDFDAACWELAGSNGRICLRAGVNVPTGDLLVYSCARRHGARLLHRDRHFDLMDAACSL